MTHSDIDALLPLKPATFLVLLVLNGGPAHGYGIKKEVLERSDGSVVLDAGGLYRLIARLEEQGLVQPTEAPDVAEHDPRRNYYGITAVGTKVVSAEARRMAALVGLNEVVALVNGAD